MILSGLDVRIGEMIGGELHVMERDNTAFDYILGAKMAPIQNTDGIEFMMVEDGHLSHFYYVVNIDHNNETIQVVCKSVLKYGLNNNYQPVSIQVLRDVFMRHPVEYFSNESNVLFVKTNTSAIMEIQMAIDYARG